jgi:predicted dithiol-disulfide oxidoreductase (DUF899 family)
MTNSQIVSGAQWVEARKALLEKEKAYSRARDDLNVARRALPWHEIGKDYHFDSAKGRVSLSDLFADKSQLLVQHFMFGPEWDEGCKSCSMMADHINASIPHLGARDVSFTAISRTPLDKLLAYHERMSWDFGWVSSLGSDFNYDFKVSFPQADVDAKDIFYNYADGNAFPNTEGPGLSAFYKDEGGAIYHTYSVYARGLEAAIGIYSLLDMVAKGRDEDGLDFNQAWFRRHDEYGQ